MTINNEEATHEMTQDQKEVVEELKEAMQHLNKALTKSVQNVKKNEDEKQMMLDIWEEFMKSFVKKAKTQSKEANVNLMSQIPLKKLLGF